MPAKFFLDTNIFVYSFDPAHSAKQRRSRELIGLALNGNTGLVSYQVIQEFFHVAMQKFEKPFSADDCKLYLDRVFAPLCEVFPNLELYRSALEVKSETGFSFYDSLIVASAVEGGCKIIYSEDLQSGRKVLGVTIQNPF